MNQQSRRIETDRAAALALEMRTLLGKLVRRLRDQTGTDDFSPSQAAVVLRLERDGPATRSHLARAEAMRPQSMSAVIAALQAAGLVRGAPDPHDARQTLLSLTPRCRSLLHKRREARQDWLTGNIRARLTPREQEKLAEVLAILSRLVED
jgi:DNA-binding MarR family transcriptional regulator